MGRTELDIEELIGKEVSIRAGGIFISGILERVDEDWLVVSNETDAWEGSKKIKKKRNIFVKKDQIVSITEVFS